MGCTQSSPAKHDGQELKTGQSSRTSKASNPAPGSPRVAESNCSGIDCTTALATQQTTPVSGHRESSKRSTATVELADEMKEPAPKSGERGDMLLLTSSDITLEKKAAFSSFHAGQHRGLYSVIPELEMLHDVHLDSVLGYGGFAAVLRGWWRGSSEVAVKIFATPPSLEELQNEKGQKGHHQPSPAQQQGNGQGDIPLINGQQQQHQGSGSSGSEGAVPAKALAEALLARDLAHPNIVRTYDVRCCRLSPEFLNMLLLPSGKASRGAPSLVQEAMQKYNGMTPLHGNHVLSHPDDDAVSGDGFGAADTASNRPAMSWQELLPHIGARAGDYLTVIIMQYCSFGTLLGAIERGLFVRRPAAPDADKRKRLRAILRTAREIAKGLEHLHACNVVHGDIKPQNVLLADSRLDSRGFTALLSDFGLARVVHNSRHQSKSAAGTTNYMAPELFLEGEVSRSTDIYAFGITLWYLVHGKDPFPGMTPAQVIAATVKGLRPAWLAPPEAQLPALQDMFLRCVTPQPKLRPTAAQLVAELAALEGEARNEAAAAQAAAVAAARASADALGSRMSSGQPGTPGSVTPGQVTPVSVTPGRGSPGTYTPPQVGPSGSPRQQGGAANGGGGGGPAGAGYGNGHVRAAPPGMPSPQSPRHGPAAGVRLPAAAV